MLNSLLCAFFFLVSFVLNAQVDSLIKVYQEKVNKYLDKEHALGGYYLIDSSGVSIFASPEDKLANKTEFRVLWNQVNGTDKILPFKSKPYSLDSALKGYRIAIDAGHMARDMEFAKMEKKYLDMKVNGSQGTSQEFQLIESQLTFETAFLLKDQLERAGAVVFLSRPDYYGMEDFNQWMRESFKAAVDTAFSGKEITAEEKRFLFTKATRREVFKSLFVNFETKERARKINAFEPDLTVIIHFNVDEKNTGWVKPTTKDYNMAFVGGSFMKNELDNPLARAEFLRLLLSTDMENSVALSSSCIKSFEKNLGIATAGTEDATYLGMYCLATEKAGVYCRNLTLTRMIHGPLVYGETLYQDNLSELNQLSEKTIYLKGLCTSERVQQVANAYAEAILDFTGQKMTK